MSPPPSSLLLSLLLLLLLLLHLSPSHSKPLSSIHNACNATRTKLICYASLAHFDNLPSDPTPRDLILRLLIVAHVKNDICIFKSDGILAASIIDKNINKTIAANNCIEGLTYANRRLTYASRALRKGTAGLADIRAWLSAALLYQNGCYSGMKRVETNTTDAKMLDVMAHASYLTNVTSSALSMVAAMQHFGNDTSKWGPPLTERDGYWGSCGAQSTECSELGTSVGVPAGLEPNATVCEDGCEFYSIQAAVDAYPKNSSGRYVIHIKAGIYYEIVRVGFDKKNVVFIGDGMNKTIITGDLHVGVVGVTTYDSATVGVLGDGFMASNLTIKNTAGPDVHQAVAFRSDSDHSIIQSVKFVGHQDTLYTHSLRQLYKNCTISGTIDFIFGDAAAFFQDCHIEIVNRELYPEEGEVNVVAAQGRIDPAQSTGFVFYNCVIDGSPKYMAYYHKKPANHRNFLARPWKEYSRTVFIDCYLGEIIHPQGWLEWIGDFALKTLFFGEYGSKGPGANVTGRISWSNQIPEVYVPVYSVENFIQLKSKVESRTFNVKRITQTQ